MSLSQIQTPIFRSTLFWFSKIISGVFSKNKKKLLVIFNFFFFGKYFLWENYNKL